MGISLERKNKRVHWVDIAKGLLMIIVVMSHMDEATSVDDSVGHALNSSEQIYNSFFMAAFFVITGLCSNFYKPWKEYIKSNFHSLIVPGFCLLLLVRCVCVYPLMLIHHNWMGVFGSICDLTSDTLLYGSAAWFLAAMFGAKILFKAILQITKRTGIQAFLVVGIGLLGLYAKNAELTFCGFWRLCYAMIFLPYLWGVLAESV